MTAPFRVLIIDDSEQDARLIARTLRRQWPKLNASIHKVDENTPVDDLNALARVTAHKVPFRNGHGGSIDVTGQEIVNGWLYGLSGYGMLGQLPGNMLLAYRVGQRH